MTDQNGCQQKLKLHMPKTLEKYRKTVNSYRIRDELTWIDT